MHRSPIATLAGLTANLSAPRALRVLLADDLPIARHAMARFLRSLPDFDVYAECENGSVAVDRALAQPPDLVILDVQMPVMDGQDAARLIRAAAPGVCIIMTSVNEDVPTQEACLAAGADVFVSKTYFKERFADAFAQARDAATRRRTLKSTHKVDMTHPAQARAAVCAC